MVSTERITMGRCITLLFLLGLCTKLIQAMPDMQPMASEGLDDAAMLEEDNHDSVNYMEDEQEWESVGTLVMAQDDESDPELDEELDVSDPPVLSDEMCPYLLAALDSEPEKVMDVLDDLKLDHVGRNRCVKTRHYDYRFKEHVDDTSTASANLTSLSRHPLCSGPLYLVYKKFRYCCRRKDQHPLLERRRNRVRCKCGHNIRRANASVSP